MIESFNKNMPFDQFTIENLAGDLLPNATLSQKIASGFNRLHRHNEEGGSDPDEFRVVYAVDRTNTTAETWMGLTIGCARCHDHKYDPITQREYYSLYAFFNSLKGEVPIIKGPVCPPQVRVPDRQTQETINQYVERIRTARNRLGEMGPDLDARFLRWKNAAKEDGALETAAVSSGIIGGMVDQANRSFHYADTSFEKSLSLNDRLQASGSVLVTPRGNSEAIVGHFFTEDGTQEQAAIGLEIAKGPRFFAIASLRDGEVSRSAPIELSYDRVHEWNYDYQPDKKLLSVSLQQQGMPKRLTTLDLSSNEDTGAFSLNAFGVSARGLKSSNAAIEFFLDNIVYVVCVDGTRRHNEFDVDPKWSGMVNASGSRRFGFIKEHDLRTIAHVDVKRMLRKPAKDLTAEQCSTLENYYIWNNEPEYQSAQNQVLELEQALAGLENSLPLALVWEEMDTPRPAHLLIRGDYQQIGEIVERDVPKVLPECKRSVNSVPN